MKECQKCGRRFFDLYPASGSKEDDAKQITDHLVKCEGLTPNRVRELVAEEIARLALRREG